MRGNGMVPGHGLHRRFVGGSVAEQRLVHNLLLARRNNLATLAQHNLRRARRCEVLSVRVERAAKRARQHHLVAALRHRRSGRLLRSQWKHRRNITRYSVERDHRTLYARADR